MNGELYVRTELRGGATIIADSYCSAPLKVAKPFIRGSETEIVIMSATPGLLDGDALRIRFDVGEGCKLRVTTQSYAKVFRSSASVGASQHVELNLAANTELRWLPQPTVPFAGSVARFVTDARVDPTGKLLLIDTLTAGRSAMGERFCFESYRSRTSVRVGGKLAFLDNCRLVPSEANIGGIGFFEGYDVQTVAYVYGFEFPQLLNFPEFAMSQANIGYSLRGLTDGAAVLNAVLSGR
jgi:urease accessory protein